MDTKLTLRLRADVIERAKAYAHENHMSLSKMVESYLDRVTKQEVERGKPEITPLVESLLGVIDLPADFDYRKENRDFLEKKYK
jgi:hypothetical protein